jgi:hypothetical protein
LASLDYFYGRQFFAFYDSAGHCQFNNCSWKGVVMGKQMSTEEVMDYVKGKVEEMIDGLPDQDSAETTNLMIKQFNLSMFAMGVRLAVINTDPELKNYKLNKKQLTKLAQKFIDITYKD